MAKKHFTNQAAAEAAELREALEATQAPFGPRALLVTLGDNGQIEHKFVGRNQSVLDIQADLKDHLSDGLFDVGFFEDLRDYCEGRLAAIAEARNTGGFVVPRAPHRWEIAHVNPIQPLQVLHV